MIKKIKQIWNEIRYFNFLKINGGVDPCESLREKLKEKEEILSDIKEYAESMNWKKIVRMSDGKN